MSDLEILEELLVIAVTVICYIGFTCMFMSPKWQAFERKVINWLRG